MKLSTKAWLAGVVLFVGSMPHAVGAILTSAPTHMMTHIRLAQKPCEVPIKYMKAQAKKLGQEKALDLYGSTREWKALFTLWDRESRWDYTADNPHSSAFGIPQMLNMSKDTPMTRQIELGLKYIDARYGSPTKALAFHNRNGWY
jgi:hypothetical protein